MQQCAFLTYTLFSEHILADLSVNSRQQKSTFIFYKSFKFQVSNERLILFPATVRVACSVSCSRITFFAQFETKITGTVCTPRAFLQPAIAE